MSNTYRCVLERDPEPRLAVGKADFRCELHTTEAAVPVLSWPSVGGTASIRFQSQAHAMMIIDT